MAKIGFGWRSGRQVVWGLMFVWVSVFRSTDGVTWNYRKIMRVKCEETTLLARIQYATPPPVANRVSAQLTPCHPSPSRLRDSDASVPRIGSLQSL